MEPNDDFDLQSVFSSQLKKEKQVSLNNSFSYETENIMSYYNIELGKEKNQLDIEAIFSNKNDKLKIEDEVDTENEIIFKNDNQKRNLATAFTEQRKTEKKYFKIKRTKLNKYYKKKGRKRKNSTPEFSKRNKNSYDNIRNGIINIFINRLQIYINSKLFKTKPKQKLLKKIGSIHKKYPKIEELKIFLQKKIDEIFSEPLSDRCTKYKKDYNKNLISKLRNNNNLKEINNIFNQTVQQMYENYINNTIPEFNLNKDLEKIKQEDENYAENFKNNAINLVKLIYGKKGRKRQ